MPTTRARSTRRAATKRTILSALDENNPSTNHEDVKTLSKSSNIDDSYAYHSNNNQSSVGQVQVPVSKPFDIPKELDCTSTESINILLEDLNVQVQKRKENIAIVCCEAIKKQEVVYLSKTMQIKKSIKRMTIRDFNQKFMMDKDNQDDNSSAGDNEEEKQCDQDGERARKEGDILSLIKSLMNQEGCVTSNNAMAALSKKRFRDDNNNMQYFGKMDLETPVRQFRTNGKNIRTPATILRTAKRGEHLLSFNGSPVEQTQEGDLVATVSKKRKGNATLGEVIFDINVGQGKVLSLSDPNSMAQMSSDMKTTSKAHLKVLQDQITRLMSELES
mmetsp:Transcript_22371/g.25918  ORF Transcript_22371/g.25918 Transcript_22371/m.25918 type:complete len:332 (+) Transcript_22371:220-1215(+)